MAICYGCGRESAPEGYRIVAVVKKDDGSGFVSKDVCDNCHRDPAHRKRTIKGHFFQKDDAPIAVALAGSSTIRG